jgi:hypothetical protein
MSCMCYAAGINEMRNEHDVGRRMWFYGLQSMFAITGLGVLSHPPKNRPQLQLSNSRLFSTPVTSLFYLQTFLNSQFHCSFGIYIEWLSQTNSNFQLMGGCLKVLSVSCRQTLCVCVPPQTILKPSLANWREATLDGLNSRSNLWITCIVLHLSTG